MQMTTESTSIQNKQKPIANPMWLDSKTCPTATVMKTLQHRDRRASKALTADSWGLSTRGTAWCAAYENKMLYVKKRNRTGLWVFDGEAKIFINAGCTLVYGVIGFSQARCVWLPSEGVLALVAASFHRLAARLHLFLLAMRPPKCVLSEAKATPDIQHGI